jgi:HK97 family phage major capsid protein
MAQLTRAQIEARIADKKREADAITAGADANSILTDEQQTAFDTVMQAIVGLKQALENRKALDELDRRSAGSAVGTGDPRLDQEAGRVSFLDAVRASLPHEMRSELTRDQLYAADRARTVSEEMARRSGRKPKGIFWNMGVRGAAEQRVLSTFGPPGGPGSNLIQTTLAPTVQDRLRERVLVRKMGASVMTGMVGNFALPRLDTSAIAQWIPEGGAITATDPAFDQVLFTPKHCGGIVSLSRNMLMQPSYDMTTLVEDDLARVLAVALDRAALAGTGVNDPLGLLTAGSGITIVPAATIEPVGLAPGPNGNPPSWQSVIALIKAVDVANALDGSLGFITNGRAVAAMRTTTKQTNDTIGNFIMSEADQLAGFPLGSTQIMPNTLTAGTGTGLSGLIFGDWSMLVIAFWSELDILVNPYDPGVYPSGGLLVRCMMTATTNTRQPKAFAALTDVLAP